MTTQTLTSTILQILKSCGTTLREMSFLQDFWINRIVILIVVLTMANAVTLQAQTRPSNVALPSSIQAAKSYVCPMHPEVKSTRPGKCPKCKMGLRLAKSEPSVAKPTEPTPSDSSGS